MEHSCCFFGHRDCPDSIKSKLKKCVLELIEENNVRCFYVGNQGRFDQLVISVLKEIVLTNPNVNCYVVLAYLPNNKSDSMNLVTIYPEGLELVPKRYCISWRNNWLIQHSDCVICYVTHSTGGAAKFVKTAERKSRKVFNLANMDEHHMWR